MLTNANTNVGLSALEYNENTHDDAVNINYIRTQIK